MGMMMDRQEVNNSDMVCFAEGQVFSTDFGTTGLNDMVVVTGTTGCGKTTSYTESRMLHTYNTSLVVPLAKDRLKKQYAELFKARGYKVYDIDFAHPGKGTSGYDPMDYIKSDTDVINLANSIVDSGITERNSSQPDPYWDRATAAVLAAIISMVKMNAELVNRKPGMIDVIRFADSVQPVDVSRGTMATNVDDFFEKAEKVYPHNQATRLWKSLLGNGQKTGGTILSMLHTYMDGMLSDNLCELFKKRTKPDLAALGREKSVVFVTTSPFDTATQHLLNIFYADLFRALFEEAESRPDNRLKIPVHVICDDFGVTGKINGFEKYISIFRAAGISASLLLQSETQLEGIYGQNAATTIINNCDTYLYMGGTDIGTCTNVSKRVNKPLNTVMSIPLEQVYLFRRGSKPVIARRYQTYDDPVYIRSFMRGVHEKE